ncbi:MAG: MCP four helix bundle domain-containing protein, partial [Gemmatimonadetes bacterium]|nr:MCP four helix bundle domain-containing protein [Gemmatimonadota bacterium]
MKWTVGRRVALGFALMIGLVALLAAVGSMGLDQASDAHRAALAQERNVVDVALHAESEAREANMQYLRFLLTHQPEYLRARDSSVAHTRGLLEQLRNSITTGEGAGIWTEALGRFLEWDESTRASIAAVKADRSDVALQIREDRAAPARLALRETIDRGVQQAQKRSREISAAAEEAASRMQRRLLITAAVAIGVGLLSAWLLSHAVTGPLRATSASLASSATEILAASTQQASSTMQTSAAVAQTTTTVDEVAQTSEQAAERARAVGASAQRTAEIGRTGQRAVEESIVAMDGVREQVESIADSILVLAEQAHEHGQAVGDLLPRRLDLGAVGGLQPVHALLDERPHGVRAGRLLARRRPGERRGLDGRRRDVGRLGLGCGSGRGLSHRRRRRLDRAGVLGVVRGRRRGWLGRRGRHAALPRLLRSLD